MKKQSIFLLVIVIVMSLLSSCSDKYYSGYSSDGMYDEEMYEEPADYDVKKSEAVPDVEQKVVQRSSITAETTEFNNSVNNLTDKITQIGGYIGTSKIKGNSINSQYGLRFATIVAHIPEKEYQGFLSYISENFNVTQKSSSSENITQSYYETQSAMESLKVQEERLIAMLEKAEDLDTLLKLEDKLAEIRGKITYYESLMKSYDSSVDFPTVELHISEVLVYTEVEAVTFGERASAAFKDSWMMFCEWIKDFAIFMISALPFLLSVAAIVAIVLIIVINSSKKNKNARKNAEEYYNSISKQEHTKTENDAKK